MSISYMGMEFEEHKCPHCGNRLDPWAAPPESGWNIVLVCNNNECPYFTGEDIRNRRDESNIACRYALNPDNGYKPFAMIAWCREEF